MKIYEPTPDTEVSVPESPATVPVRKIANDRVFLRNLKPIHREMIKRLVEGQKPKEIAKALGVAKGYVGELKRQDPIFRSELERATLNRDIEVHNRMRNLAGEALDVLKDLLRRTDSDSIRLEAAKTLLDRAGYSKLEKRVTVTADAESVIRELNRRQAREVAEEIVTEAVLDAEEPECDQVEAN